MPQQICDYAIDLKKGFVLKKREDIPVIKDRERESAGICEGSVEEEIYYAIKITTDIISILCAKERWEKENSAGLLIFKQLDN